MLTALVIAATATALTLAVVVVTVVTGWFPRLAALGARVLVSLLCRRGTTGLSPRERSELAAA